MDKNESRSLYSSSPSSGRRLHEQTVNIKKVKRYIKNKQNKRAMIALDRSPESFSLQMNSTSLFLWFQLVTPGVGLVLIPRGIM